MRIQRITTNYPGFLRQFYAKRPGLDAEPFSVQHAALMEQASGWADFWSVALGKLGYEADEVVSNVEPMQRAWARERGAPFGEPGWLFDITAAQVKAFAPDVLFVNDYVTFTAPFLRRLRAECPSIRLVLGWCGAPYRDASVFREYDVVLSSVPELVEEFRAQGHRCRHVNHAFEPRVLERIDLDAPPDTDFSFVGSLAKKRDFHLGREALLAGLIGRTPLRIWAEIHRPTWRERGGTLVRRAAYDAVHAARRAGVPASVLAAAPPARRVLGWAARPELPTAVDARLARRSRPAVYGLEMYERLRRSRVTLNTHIDLSSTHASNMRLYEATGVGSCLLTDWKANLAEMFEPDAEVVTYRDADECAEKVRYLLEHEDERRRIAEAGRRRALRDHTFDCRAAQLDDLIRAALVSQ
ncbi:MAG TPA: glycosyltransferase [Pyrinomonadaceae bacterium]|nr:glycosyltransferase [Pyrinomonadaceae bacterium]